MAELGLWVPNANPFAQAMWPFSLTSVLRDHDGKRDEKDIVLESDTVALTF